MPALQGENGRAVQAGFREVAYRPITSFPGAWVGVRLQRFN